MLMVFEIAPEMKLCAAAIMCGCGWRPTGSAAKACRGVGAVEDRQMRQVRCGAQRHRAADVIVRHSRSAPW